MTLDSQNAVNSSLNCKIKGTHGFNMSLHLKPLFFFLLILALPAQAQHLTSAGEKTRLEIREAGEHSIRLTLKPDCMGISLPDNPTLDEKTCHDPEFSLTKIDGEFNCRVGNLIMNINYDPLRCIISNASGKLIQAITFHPDRKVSFILDDQPILGMGEGGPKHGEGWRDLPIEFDRRGRFHNMQPRWQGDAYGSRNPVALLIGTSGWAIYFAAPWGQIDLTDPEKGFFHPIEPAPEDSIQQNKENQQLNLGKGIPPMASMVPGMYDIFVFDAHDPCALMKDISLISGQAVMPPKWALGYMQSHRTLEDDGQMISVVDSFRLKRIPLDAVIYLGTGFCPRGWNTQQPSFDFNPEVFKRNPELVINDLHHRNLKVIVHMVPWDRDRLPTLYGNIPPGPDEELNESHISAYWQQHIPLVQSGVNAWWPDEGDWFNLYERFKRHQMYYQGPLSSEPDIRPWSLHRNGYLGIARWGGWVWSGDTESAWKTLECQIAVGINHSLSLSPYWGSDIGGFYPSKELTGELYARWFQFGAFCPSFRSHGRTWWTRLPWGWGLSEMGPLENRRNPLETELNNPAIEPICRQYAELRYRLLSYNYTLTWEARTTGMPLMRAMWLHYPEDKFTRNIGNQYLWGRDILVAPVFEKGAVTRKVYLPFGEWYDWWTGEKEAGGRIIIREVDLATMPIYIRAGAIVPLDPVRQYTGQEITDPLTLRIYNGADGSYTLYEDDGISLDYLKGDYTLTKIKWDDGKKILTIEPLACSDSDTENTERKFLLELIPGGKTKEVTYTGKTLHINLTN